VNPDGRSEIVLLCEHAGRRIPKSLGDLGLPESERVRHIAWDIGAEAVSRLLSAHLDAPLVLQRYSRLVYDCNRPPENPSAIPEVSETTRIPGNEGLTPEQKLERMAAIYRPYHAAASALLDRRAAHGMRTVIVTMHSFTPVFKGVERAVEFGILFHNDDRMARRLLPLITDCDARLNEPYAPEHGVCHTTAIHAEARGLRYAMLEIRHDLIREEAGQRQWAERLAIALPRAMADK
jgi:predicted N-formylglutamate amidohydrolase